MVVNPTDRIWDLLMFGVTESDEKVEKELNSRATVTQNRYQKKKKKKELTAMSPQISLIE